MPPPKQQLLQPLPSSAGFPVNESTVVFFVFLSHHLPLLMPPVIIVVVAFKSDINIKECRILQKRVAAS